ncbi:hypothetical protein Anas_12189 [Armadillidium nasatum]|uniref:Uncharacterized protein n=1 Tax=Armadillidium nasatum TaxID=96803 RepID=A0A5N5T465_9CRUS|nr:hypothetical protein Anas_12189 [Armadillidium nasatum]
MLYINILPLSLYSSLIRICHFRTGFSTIGIRSSSLRILSSGVENVTRSEEFLEICGAKFCPAFSANLTSPSREPKIAEEKSEDRNKIIIMSFYLFMLLYSISVNYCFICGPVEQCSLLNIEEKIDLNSKSRKELLVATFSQMQKVNQILIIPLTMWSGYEQAFLQADYTSAFVTCGMGVHTVGYVMICYGVCDAILSLCFSPLVKLIGRLTNIHLRSNHQFRDAHIDGVMETSS